MTSAPAVMTTTTNARAAGFRGIYGPGVPSRSHSHSTGLPFSYFGNWTVSVQCSGLTVD